MRTLGNELISVTVDVEYGARITSLVDRVTGREWMLQGERGADTSDTAVYGGGDAIGWDECFPTVAPWDASATAWGRVLRDHGALWGRAAESPDEGDDRIVTVHRGALFAFRRTLRIEGAAVHADYRLDNLSDSPLPYLWAAHGMLRVTPDDRIVLPGVRSATATYISIDGRSAPPAALAWPGPNPQWPDSFERVLPVSARNAAKLYVAGAPGAAAYVGGDDGWLRIGWSEEIDCLGIWLNYGGWPEPGNIHHVGLEPTNAPVDHLGQAIARGTPGLPPGARREWSVTYTLRAPAP